MSKKSISYKEAITEVEEILSKIEKEELDVDLLSDKVRRAYFLLNLCREKLYSTEKELGKIINEFSNPE